MCSFCPLLSGSAIVDPACMMFHAHEESSDAEKGKAQYLTNSY